MEVNRFRTHITLFNTALWVIITLCGWNGYWFVGLLLSVLLMLLQMVLGAAQNGKISKKLLFYPLIPWFLLWIGGFLGANYYADAFMNGVPDFTILGFHPSFAMIILAYWVGGVATLTFGLIKYSHEWLSDETWDAFLLKMKKLNGEASNER